MKKYKVISFDMFQTLVNVDERVPEIWKGVLGDEYTKEKGEIGARAIISNLSSAYERSIHPFLNMEEMFIECARNAIEQMGDKTIPEKIAYHLMYQHGYAPFYEDALSTIKKLGQEYTVIISSDSSHLMVNPLLAKCKVEKAFISDDMCCYKGDESGKFFRSVLAQLKISPDQIIHIGDSSVDIIGAHAAGIDSCWINRNHKEWKESITPDYIIYNLNDIFDIIH